MASREPKEPYVPYAEVKRKLPKNFAALAKAYAEVHEKIKVLEAVKKETGASLCAALMGAGHTRIEVDNLWVRQQDNVNVRIDPKLLLAAGVKAEAITKATVTTRTPYAVVQVKPEDSPLVEKR